jgi:DNA-binding winged helix-turn-helix (wHTH) protein
MGNTADIKQFLAKLQAVLARQLEELFRDGEQPVDPGFSGTVHGSPDSYKQLRQQERDQITRRPVLNCWSIPPQKAGQAWVGFCKERADGPFASHQAKTLRVQLGKINGQSRALKRLLTKLRVGGRKHRHESEEIAGPLIEAGDFRIDLSRRAVKVRGNELQLASAEFEMLVFLTGHRKSVVTPSTMLTTSWSGKEVRQAEFVRVLLSLRKKLDLAVGSTPSYIRTEPWIFYSFDPSLAHKL